jgi:threonine/homoserine/homoserine lactone efflux protein
VLCCEPQTAGSSYRQGKYMITSLSAGIILGLSGGFSPGPLLTLVISQSLRHGFKEGVKVAVAPLITDLPIILISIFVLARLANFRTILGIFSLIGGLFVMYLAYESFQTSRFRINIQEAEPQSLRKAIVVNALNPNPYLFWFSLGAPMIIKTWKENQFTAVAFVAGFYICLIGSKVFTAALVSKSRQFFIGRTYMYFMRALGILLLIFALLLFRDGIDLLGSL